MQIQQILTEQDKFYCQQLLIAIIDKMANYTSLLLSQLPDIQKRAAVCYLDEPIELFPGFYFTIYVISDNRNYTTMPGIKSGISKQDIDAQMINFINNDPQVHLQKMPIGDIVAAAVGRFKEFTSRDISQVPLFASFAQDGNLLNLIKMIYQMDYNSVINTIMMYISMGDFAAPVNRDERIDGRISHTQRTYTSECGPVFKIIGDITTGTMQVELGFSEPVMRAAKRDKVFRWDHIFNNGFNNPFGVR